ncbi:hypothetical protein GSI_11802 [Ganoderma sinense ZZ0214-1]|uniref:Uncharacterized protein n=1 Tax=Ganoderma sinense ZZ0214-1 TaxID=1077348 RepID=A0A2G8RXK4_9APHY|nr:hypothetical protein GSI_11802 [Ganoderma sinense ZZ0214-1]
MYLKVVPSLLILSVLSGSYAAPSPDEVSSAVYRAGLVASELVTGVVLGTDSTGHTTYAIAFAEPLTVNPTATAPDSTWSAAGTLVEGSTDAHFFEIATLGTNTVAVIQDCALGSGFAACTLVEKNANTAGAVIQSTLFTTTLAPSPSPSPSGGTTIALPASSSSTLKNGAGQLDRVGPSATTLAVVGPNRVIAIDFGRAMPIREDLAVMGTNAS